jgi:uncharacterized protein involved in high-affinity Fe2+ transport
MQRMALCLILLLIFSGCTSGKAIQTTLDCQTDSDCGPMSVVSRYCQDNKLCEEGTEEICIDNECVSTNFEKCTRCSDACVNQACT